MKQLAESRAPRDGATLQHAQAPDDMYIGPDSMMPLASAFAAVAGFLLMFWRRLVGAMRFLAQRLGAKFAKR